MKKIWVGVYCLSLIAVTHAAPVEWGGHYYEVISDDLTWGEAKSAAEGLTYNGYVGHLATLNSEAEFDFLRTIPGLGDWNITWIGGYHDYGLDDYVWVNGEGILDFSGWSSDPWEDGYPSGTAGVAITGSGYGGYIRNQSGTCGEYIVEYHAAIPEPATALMISAGGALIAFYRRFFGRV